ncbi:hypothetical protein D0Z07_5398 [Hyphodiscus hymeniophilus]|uniref:Uncharacterized protein n=1 Tax=Hyphodiscus hymeniophilus TaxID=353542 RepID=A0A9P7AWN1_9HELO|nr:hypothetical protein D0Z07_5398 [Hyphodiscus hymeniophilus]
MLLSPTNSDSYIQLRDSVLARYLHGANRPMIGKDGNSPESKAKSQKEHRRAQVRKAQILSEHRQRKENLIKHLEEDVINLREMISTVESDTLGLKQENACLKSTLSKSNIPATTVPLPNLQPIQQRHSPSGVPTNFQSPQREIRNSNAEFDSLQQSNWPSNSSSSNVSVTFDEFIEKSVLQVSPHGSFDNDVVSNAPEVLNLPASTFSQHPRTAASSNDSLQKPLPHLPGQSAPSASSSKPDISTAAINFILAKLTDFMNRLEHPCRTHFDPHPHVFDPTGEPTGHELMASTLLYSHAPEYKFQDYDSMSWTAPSLELSTLWEMSQSLPKADFEITPVQAWFKLSQNYDAEQVLRNLEGLKRGISKLVACFEFGAVMDEQKFWNVVKDVMLDVMTD